MIPYLRFQDIADILIMSFLLYQLYSWFKNTKALQVVIGLGSLVVLYVITKNLGLFMTSWVLQELGTVLIILVIVIFQNEIRQALYRFSLMRSIFGRQATGPRLDYLDLARAVFALATERTGAIIAFQRREPIDEYLLHGVPLDSLVSAQLISSIFRDGTPLHDGALVIREGRITQASCHLPLSASVDLPQHFGTRHRAALGLTERSDALVVVVSEERGTVSLALEAQLQPIVSAEQLAERLQDLLAAPVPEPAAASLQRRFFSNIWPKVVTVLLVVICWLVITARQGGIITVTVPIKFRNLPDSLVLMRSVPEEVEVQLKSLSSLIPTPKQMDIVADVDLAKVRDGVHQLAIPADTFQLPLGVVVTGVTPSQVKVTVERKVRKELPVQLRTTGSPPRNLLIKKMRVEPVTVTVVGPESSLAELEAVPTEELDLAQVRQSGVVEKKLLAPRPQLKFLPEEPIRVRIVAARRQGR